METAHLPWGINGLPIASKYIAWIELIVFHILTPDASFLGHLAGILAGVLYTSTPVGFLFDVVVSKITGNSNFYLGSKKKKPGLELHQTAVFRETLFPEIKKKTGVGAAANCSLSKHQWMNDLHDLDLQFFNRCRIMGENVVFHLALQEKVTS